MAISLVLASLPLLARRRAILTSWTCTRTAKREEASRFKETLVSTPAPEYLTTEQQEELVDWFSNHPIYDQSTNDFKKKVEESQSSGPERESDGCVW